MKKCFHTLCLAAALLMGSFSMVSEADALTLQEIIVMSGQGLSDDVLSTIIGSSDSVPELTAADRENLKKSGVSERVIRAIDARRSAMTGVSEPQADAVPSTGNSGAVGDNAILAPVETSNVPLIFRKFFEEAAETYQVQSEIARQYSKLQDETQAVHAHDSDIPRVLAWQKQVSESPVSALESCFAFYEERNPPQNTPIATALNQCLGFALQAMDAPAMGAVYLDLALMSDARIYGVPKTLTAFLDMAHQWGYTSQDPLKIKEHASEVRGEQRPEFLYLTAYSFVYGPQPDVRKAAQLLQNIVPGTIYYPRAKILLATLAVRAPEYKFKTAAEHLNEAIKSLEKFDSPEAFELRNTAWLTLGRIAFENHAYDQAHAFYSQVDVRSHHLKDSLLEDAWGQLFAGKFAEALSLTHALHAPIFKKAWLPDLALIEAGAYLGLCRYDMARQVLDHFRSTVLADAGVLNRYMAKTPGRDYYNQVLSHAEGLENPVLKKNDGILPETIYRRVLSDFSFQMLHRAVRKLTDERQNLSRYAGAGFSSWPKLAAVYDGQIARYQDLINARLSGIYDEVLSELHGLDISASQMAIEIRLAERRREAACLKIVASGGHCETSGTGADDARSLMRGESDAYWKFEGEFWRDELRHYVSGLTSQCVE